MNKRPWWLLPPGRIHPMWWMALGAALLWIDHFAGPPAQFPVLYALPVSLAAWYSGKWPALALAIAVPLFRLAFLLPSSVDLTSLIFATTLRGLVIVFMALWFARLAELERNLSRRVNVLEGLLPICSFCKNIRNDAGDWERLETFISRRSEAQFSHSVCPSCGDLHYPGELTEG